MSRDETAVDNGPRVDRAALADRVRAKDPRLAMYLEGKVPPGPEQVHIDVTNACMSSSSSPA